MYLRAWSFLQISEGAVAAISSCAGGSGVKQSRDVLQEVCLPGAEGELGRVVGVHGVIVGHRQGHPHVASGGLGLGRVAVVVITLDPVSSPAWLAATLVMLSVPKLDIEQALGLLVTLMLSKI